MDLRSNGDFSMTHLIDNPFMHVRAAINLTTEAPPGGSVGEGSGGEWWGSEKREDGAGSNREGRGEGGRTWEMQHEEAMEEERGGRGVRKEEATSPRPVRSRAHTPGSLSELIAEGKEDVDEK